MTFFRFMIPRNILKIVSFIMLFGIMSISNSNAADINDIRIGQGIDNLRIVFDSDSEFVYEVFLLDEPRRLVVDVIDVVVNKNIENKRVDSEVVRSVRVGEKVSDTTRVVIDLKKNIVIQKTFKLPPQSNLPWRMVIDIKVVSEKVFKENLKTGKNLSSSTSLADKIKGILSEPVVKSNRPIVKAPKESVAKESSSSGLSFASNNSKTKKIIVLDAGHGGKDPGAVGFSGVYEKTITLSMAKELKAILDKNKRYKVYLTRSGDKFISLRERVNIARKYDADLFVSIHADSAKNRNALGLSVYTLSETASDKEAAALADRENKADIIAGLNLVEHSKEVSDILINLAQRETMNRSSEFAGLMVGEMKKSVKLVSDTHRFAGFAVLKAPDIPSVLLEMGYLSNRREEGLLKQKGYRNKLAISTQRAIDEYFRLID